MSKHCCIPGCPGKRPDVLFNVPAKSFCTGEKQEWATKLECIILSIRADEGIKKLYKKDNVKICSRHFKEDDIVQSKFDTKLRFIV